MSALLLAIALAANPLPQIKRGIDTARSAVSTASTVQRMHQSRQKNKAPKRATVPQNRTEPQPAVQVPDVESDILRLRRALHAMPDVLPDLVAEAPCSSPAVYRETAKNECVILDFGEGIGLAMLYYPGLRGNNPKPAKAYTMDSAGIWTETVLPRPE